MSTKLPERPKKGAKIPHDYFQRMWDHQKSLELHGDLNTTTVRRDQSGTTVSAHNVGGGSQSPSTRTRVAKIDTDNGDGTYDATEQKNTSGAFADGDTDFKLVFDSGNDGNLYELNGIVGIPVGDIVVVHRVANTNGGPIWYFDSSISPDGTLDTLNAGEGTTANTDSWDREDQGATQGEEHQFVARLTLDSSTGELLAFCRDQEHSARGHEESISAESRKVLGVLTPSTETYEFVDCDTGAVTVARFAYADLPDDDYCHIYDGTNYVMSYNDGISAGSATSPVPCIVYAPSTPANCAALDVSDFDEDFADTLLTPCPWGTDGGGTYTSGYLEIVDVNIDMIPPSMPDEFTVVFDYSASWPTASTGQITRVATFIMYIGGVRYDFRTDRNEGPHGASGGTSIYAAGTLVYSDSTVQLSGSYEISRNGSDLVSFKRGGSTIHTLTKAGDQGLIIIGGETNEVSTGMYLRCENLSFTTP